MSNSCEHNWLFAYSGKGFDFNGNYRHTAHICRDCGVIHISGSVNFVPFSFEFTLNSDELIKAAGQQLPFIDVQEDVE